MFKKKYDDEDEKREIPEILKLLISIAVIALMFFGTYYLCEYAEKAELRKTNPEYVIEEDL